VEFKECFDYLFSVRACWQISSGVVLVGCLLGSTIAAATPRNPADYEAIVKRNPFDLRPPQPPPPPPPPPAPPPSNIELTGLVTAWGRKQVLMTIKDAKGQPVNKALSVGDPPDDGIEVLDLNMATGEVRVRNRGVESLLSLKTHGAKVPVGAAPAPLPAAVPSLTPGQPAVPAPAAANAGGMPSGFTEPGGAGGTAEARPVIPTRSIRVPVAPPGQPTSQLTPPTQAPAQLNPEVEAQIIQMEINRLINQGGPPLPPTPLSPAQ
jgi:hypothetical protein